MSRQLGSIDDWSTSSNSGSINPDQGQRPSVFRGDCSSELQAKLDAGGIPPNSEIRVSYDLDFSTGSPIARNVQSAALMANVQVARSSIGGGLSRRVVARAKPAKRADAPKKPKKKAGSKTQKRKSAKKRARKRNR